MNIKKINSYLYFLHYILKRIQGMMCRGRMTTGKMFWLFILSILFNKRNDAAVNTPILRVPIQSFSTSLDDGLKLTMEWTLDRLNSATPRTFLLQHRHQMLSRVPANDGWALMGKVCSQLESPPGFALMLVGQWRPRMHQPFWLVSAGMQVPMLNWALSPRAFEGGTNDFEMSLRPPNAQLLADIISMKNWTEFVYLHDWENGETAAQTARQICQHWHQKAVPSSSYHLVELPKDSSEFGLFLGHLFSAERNKSRLATSLDQDSTRRPLRILLDAANIYRQQKLIQAIIASAAHLDKKENVHFLVANYDFLPTDVELMEKHKVSIVGIQLVDREGHEYGQLMRRLQAAKVTTSGRAEVHLEATRLAFLHDALVLAKAGLMMTLKHNQSLFTEHFAEDGQLRRNGIRCHLGSSNDSTVAGMSFKLGKMLTKTLARMKLDSQHGTLTGNVEFDSNGIRKNFEVNVIDLVVEDERSIKKIHPWRHSTGFLKEEQQLIISRSLQPRPTSSASVTPIEAPKRPLRVATVLQDPFMMLRSECVPDGEQSQNVVNGTSTWMLPAGCEGNARFEGYCPDLLKLLSERIPDFEYEIFVSNGNRFGKRQPDGSYDGITTYFFPVGNLLRGEADLSVASLTINQERERVIDFSQPFMTAGISIMILKPDKEDFSLLRFMAPLSHEVWLCIMIAFVGVSIVIYVAARFSPFEVRDEPAGEDEMPPADGIYRKRRRRSSDPWTIFNSLWFTWAALLGSGGEMSPRSLSVRLASSTWFFFTLIMISSYTANLAAFLTIERMQTPIESVEDLAKQTKIKYGIQQGGSTEQFFRHSSVQIYQRMWKFMEDQIPSAFVDTYAEGVARVRADSGHYAFLLESTANEYVNMRKPCNTLKVGENLNTVGYGVATPFGSDLKESINLAILALQETGQLRKLQNKWWYDRGQCNEEGGIDSSTESLTLRNVAGVFYVLIAGLLLSLLVAFVERICQRRRQQQIVAGCRREENGGKPAGTKRMMNHSRQPTTTTAEDDEAILGNNTPNDK